MQLDTRRNQIYKEKLWFYDDVSDCGKVGANRNCGSVDNSQSEHPINRKISTMDRKGEKDYSHIFPSC